MMGWWSGDHFQHEQSAMLAQDQVRSDAAAAEAAEGRIPVPGPASGSMVDGHKQQ